MRFAVLREKDVSDLFALNEQLETIAPRWTVLACQSPMDWEWMHLNLSLGWVLGVSTVD
jgi:hypothetical protein